MARFYWRQGFRARVPAEIVGEELERIRNANRGRLTPADVVEAARRRGSPIRDLFTWDDTEAARKWRLHEARRVIACIVVPHPRKPKERLIAYVSVTDPEEGRCYKESFEVMGDDELRQQAVSECRRMIEAWRRRFRGLDDIARALDEFDGALPR